MFGDELTITVQVFHPTGSLTMFATQQYSGTPNLTISAYVDNSENIDYGSTDETYTPETNLIIDAPSGVAQVFAGDKIVFPDATERIVVQVETYLHNDVDMDHQIIRFK